MLHIYVSIIDAIAVTETLGIFSFLSLFFLFIDQSWKKLREGGGTALVFGALNRLRYVSNYTISLSLFLLFFFLFPDWIWRWRRKPSRTENISHHPIKDILKDSFKKGNKKTILCCHDNQTIFCFVLYFLTGELEQQQVDGGGPVPSKSCGGCVLVKKGEEPSGTNRKIGNTPFPLDDQLKKRGKKGFPKLPLFFFISFLFFFSCPPYNMKGTTDAPI
jgi:hypothetical protein